MESGTGTTRFSPQMGMFPEAAFEGGDKALKINVIKFLLPKVLASWVMY